MKLISWNVNGIRATMKKGFEEFIKNVNPDVLCLQETKATVEQTLEALKNIQGYEIFANDSKERKGYSGTAILTKKKPLKAMYDINIPEHDNEGRVTAVEFDDYILVDVYVPNSGDGLKRLDYRSIWDKDFTNYLKKLMEKKPVIVTGDFNVAHKPIDLARPDSNYDKTAGYTQIEIDGYENLLNAGFIDSYRHFHPDKVEYTFWNQRFKARDRNIGWRIDTFLVDKRIISSVKSAYILNDIFGSDHCPVGIEI